MPSQAMPSLRYVKFVPRPIKVALKGAMRVLRIPIPQTQSSQTNFYTKSPNALPVLENCLKIAASQNFDGDYYEFGLWQGYTFWFAQKVSNELGNTRMRYWGFDSFEGLPEAEGIQEPRRGFSKGDYAASLQEVTENLTRSGVDWSKTKLIEGFYAHSLRPELKQFLGLKPIAAALIDCDIYVSTVPVLNFISDLLREGSVLLFDDWNCFGASNNHGQRKAFSEFLQANPQWEAEKYAIFGWHGQAFIMHWRES
jgi:O-methyltransferase